MVELSTLSNLVNIADGHIRYHPEPEDTELWSGVCFYDRVWAAPLTNAASMVFDVQGGFETPLRQYAITALSTGGVVGDEGLAWRTVIGRVNAMARWCRFLHRRKVFDFTTLSTLPTVRINTLVLDFLLASPAQCGLNIESSPTSFVDFMKAAKLAVKHGWLPMEVYGIFKKIGQEKVGQHVVLSHPIIPTGIVKQLLADVESRIGQARCNFSALSGYYEIVDKRIASAVYDGSSLGEWVRGLLTRSERKGLSALYTPFKRLRSDCYALLLLMTGMRKEEALSVSPLADGHSGNRITATLTKTAASPMQLQWVVDGRTQDALRLLGEFNALLYRRAEALINALGTQLTEDVVAEYRQAIAQPKLFGVHPSMARPSFGPPALITSEQGGGTLSLHHLRYPLSQADIQVLDAMDCNYRAMGKHRGNSYQVGDSFELTSHQFRHTFAWFVVANRLGDLDDIKYQFKHLSDAMTLVYAQRGFDSMADVLQLVSHFESALLDELVEEVTQAAGESQLGGGGGRLLNRGAVSRSMGATNVHGEVVQLHFKNHHEYVDFVKNNFSHVRAMPHGFCTAGPSCKMTNVAEPASCVNCKNYVVAPRHHAYWEMLKFESSRNLDVLMKMKASEREHYSGVIAVTQHALEQAERILLLAERKTGVVHE